MKRRLSRWLPILLALVMTLGLAACGGSGSETAQTPEEEPAYTEIETVEDENTQAPEEASPAQEKQENERGLSQQGEDSLDEDGWYTTKEDVALYLHLYQHLPDNFITKKEAQALGWTGGSLEPYAPGCSIGGSRFGNYEGLLPDKKGRTWTECDIDTMGAKSRGPKRIVFSNDGLIYYTGDHYESFELLYGEE